MPKKVYYFYNHSSCVLSLYNSPSKDIPFQSFGGSTFTKAFNACIVWLTQGHYKIDSVGADSIEYHRDLLKNARRISGVAEI